MISPSVARALLGIAGILLYSLAMHYTSAVNPNRDWAAALVIAPFLGAALLIAWRSPRRMLQLTVCATAIAALALFWPRLTAHVGWLYLLQHAGIYFLLGLMFGRTLVHQRTPLCTQFASFMTDHMTPRVCRYTRQVTVAWTVFFFATASISALLFFFSSFENWSIFANLLGLPLLGTMFTVEFAIRLRVLAPEERGSLRKTWQAWKNHGAAKPAPTNTSAAAKCTAAIVPPPPPA